MSMLDRYRKPGGFVQLLSLIETCSKAKQEKLLESVAQEDRHWSELVRIKMLTIDRIYSWNDEALCDIFAILQDLTVSVALYNAKPDFRARMLSYFTHARIRKLEDLRKASGPSEAEVTATHMKIIETVRRMANEGVLTLANVEPVLIIEDDIDDQLAQFALVTPILASRSAAITSAMKSVPTKTASTSGAAPRVLHAYSPLSEHLAAKTVVDEMSHVTQISHISAAYSPYQSTDANESRLAELQALKKRVADLSKDNATLRHELSLAKSKLDQIRKIA